MTRPHMVLIALAGLPRRVGQLCDLLKAQLDQTESQYWGGIDFDGPLLSPKVSPVVLHDLRKSLSPTDATRVIEFFCAAGITRWMVTAINPFSTLLCVRIGLPGGEALHPYGDAWERDGPGRARPAPRRRRKGAEPRRREGRCARKAGC